MKLTSVRGIGPEPEVSSSAREALAGPAKSNRGARCFDGLAGALKGLPATLSRSRQPVTSAPRRSMQSLQHADAHRNGDIAAAIEHMHKGHANNKPPLTHASTVSASVEHVGRSVNRRQVQTDKNASTSHSQPPRRLLELMHEENPSSVTRPRIAKGKYTAKFQLRPPEAPAFSAIPSVEATGSGSTRSTTSDGRPESDDRIEEPGDVSIRWAADSRPTNLLWQKIDSAQKQAILNALSDKGDLTGVALWEGADRGDKAAMDRLDDHLLQHYYKDESGNANRLRFAPAKINYVPEEATPADTRTYMNRVQPLLDAHLETTRVMQQVSATGSGVGWFTSLFKKARKQA